MIGPALIVARNTYRELLRDRVLYFLVVFSILFLGLCFAVGQLSYEEIFRLSVSLGLGGIHICYMGLTIFLGCSLFYREIERKTIYTVLARGINRDQYLFGKYLGLLLTLLTMLVGFALCFTLIEAVLGVPVLLSSYSPFLGFFLESCVLLAISFLLASFTKPFLSITGAIAFFLIGHWVGSLSYFIERSENLVFKNFAMAVQRTFPDLEMFNWRGAAVAQTQVLSEEFLSVSLGGLLWTSFFFLLALIVFRRKDFE